VHARFASSARVFGGGGDDVIVGSDGADQIFPGPGRALVVAGAGDDTVTIYDPCELATGTRLDGGDGNDTLVTPVPADALAAAGVQVTGFENVIVDATHAYLSECF
jgi:Ca2+-binding RTX toxin-like protein